MAERKKKLAAERFQQRQAAGLQRKRMVMDKLLHEEIDEVTMDRALTVWISAVATNTTPVATVRAVINSVGARALAKAMWTNETLVNLDLSRNDLDETAGMYLARMLRNNKTLVKLEVSTSRNTRGADSPSNIP